MKKSACIISLVICLILLSGLENAHAGEIVHGASVRGVTNTANNIAGQFAIRVSGGTGPCTGNTYITFPISSVSGQNVETHKRTFNIALAASVTGDLVNIYNYESNTCDKAVFIELTK